MINLKLTDERLNDTDVEALSRWKEFLLSEMQEKQLYQISVADNFYSDYILLGICNQYLFCTDVWETNDSQYPISYNEDWEHDPKLLGKVTKIHVPFMQENFESNRAAYEELFDYSSERIITLLDVYFYYIYYGMTGIDEIPGEIEVFYNTHICDVMDL